MNVVMTADGRLVEVQATAEKEAFPRELLDELLDLAPPGSRELGVAQAEACEAPRRSEPERGPRTSGSPPGNPHKLDELRRVLPAAEIDLLARDDYPPGDGRHVRRERPWQGALRPAARRAGRVGRGRGLRRRGGGARRPAGRPVGPLGG